MICREKPIVRSFNELAKVCSSGIDEFFFIQVGANDGRIGDPIFHLVTELGWKGILVEPQRWVYEEYLVQNYAGYDNLFFENVAIDDMDGRRELFKLAFSNRRWATGLASFKKSHIEHHIENGYVDRMIGDERDQLPNDLADYISSEVVTTMSFDTLLDKYLVEHLDLLQIDTEGHDYRLLQMFDFNRLRPSIIQFEHHVMTEEQRGHSLDLLHDYGYLTFKEHINIVGLQRSLAQDLELCVDLI